MIDEKLIASIVFEKAWSDYQRDQEFTLERRAFEAGYEAGKDDAEEKYRNRKQEKYSESPKIVTPEHLGPAVVPSEESRGDFLARMFHFYDLTKNHVLVPVSSDELKRLIQIAYETYDGGGETMCDNQP
jgi:hypothetical protein